MAAQHGAGSISGPPPVPPPTPIPEDTVSVHCRAAGPSLGFSSSHPPLLVDHQAPGFTVPKLHAHSYMFLTKRDVFSPGDVCHSLNPKALNCSQLLKISLRCLL